jgi:hypothetical protein
MKAEGVAEQLLLLYYRTYNSSPTVRQYGIYIRSLIDNSGIQFASRENALATIGQMKDKGWIEALADPSPEKLDDWNIIQLTKDGISHAELLS